MREIADINYMGDNDPNHLLDMYLPETDGFDTLIYIHGGGLIKGTRKTGERLFSLTDKGYGVVSIDYSLMPEAKFPQFIEESAAAVKYVFDHIMENGGNGRIYVSGSSAGAWITMHLCLDKSYLRNVGIDEKDVAGFISESAQQFAHFGIMRERGLDPKEERIDETAPIGFVKAGLEIRPLDLIYYTNDMACRPEENKLMFASMKRFLPEDAVLNIKEIDGKHVKPTVLSDLIDEYYSFMKKNRE